jgi:hypothetical protein
MSRALLLCLAYFLGAHLMTWFQLNGQFIWSWFKDHPLTLCLFGVPVSYLYILATKYSFIAFNELLWPGRFVGFAIGMITFTVFTSIFLGEGISNKTVISLLLAFILVCIQVFWK